MAVEYHIAFTTHYGDSILLIVNYAELKAQAKRLAEGLAYTRLPDNWRKADDLIRYIWADARSLSWVKRRS